MPLYQDDIESYLVGIIMSTGWVKFPSLVTMCVESGRTGYNKWKCHYQIMLAHIAKGFRSFTWRYVQPKSFLGSRQKSNWSQILGDHGCIPKQNFLLDNFDRRDIWSFGWLWVQHRAKSAMVTWGSACAKLSLGDLANWATLGSDYLLVVFLFTFWVVMPF